MNKAPVRITALHIYPIKSCRGVPVDRAKATRRGFDGDRRWMLVDDDGLFLTQRTAPTMARVDANFVGDILRVSTEEGVGFEAPAKLESGPRAEVEVWRSRVQAIVHDEGSAWFSRFLERSCRLVYMPDDAERVVDPAYGREGDVVSFADGYPYLVSSEESLADLRARSNVPVEMDRFRPNIVVRGVAPFGEDEWREVGMAAVRFRAVKKCSRCIIPSLDQRTGERGKEPLATLAKFRKEGSQVMFGMNLIADLIGGETGELRVGDEVTVFRTSAM